MNMFVSSGRSVAAAVVAAAAVVLLVVLSASPVWAHGGSGDAGHGSTPFVARVVDVSGPTAEFVDVSVVSGDTGLQVSVQEGHELVVPAYDDAGAPWIRIEEDGTLLANQTSPDYYRNQDRNGMTEVPPKASVGAEPEWVETGSTQTVTWHDHRMHLMGDELQQALEEAGVVGSEGTSAEGVPVEEGGGVETEGPSVGGPSAAELVDTWQVPLLVDGQQVIISGELWQHGDGELPEPRADSTYDLAAADGGAADGGAAGGVSLTVLLLAVVAAVLGGAGLAVLVVVFRR